MIVIAQKEKSSKVSFIEQKSKEGEDWAVLRQIQINRSYYKGNQWIAWDRIKKSIYVPDLRPGEKRLTFNKIRPHILTLLSKMCKNRVKLEVKPDTNDIERIEIAKAGLKYLHYQWDTDDMNRKSRRLKMHMLVDGSPALKVFVDRKQGQDIPKEAVPSELAADMKLPEKTGKICTQVVDQFALKVDPNAEDITEIRWALEERPTLIDDIKEEWGVEVEKEDISPRQTFEIGQASDLQKKYDNHAMVYDYWEFPNVKYPKGRRIVVAGGQELESSEDPGENPFIFFPAIPMPGRAIGEAVVSDMTTAQRSYNIKRTAEARILEEMGNPMWLSPGVNDDDELVNEIGGIVHYTPNQQLKPERVPGVEPGNGWQAAMERDEADMEDISGAHEISQGATPRGNNTLGGLQLQLEQDETKLALFVQSYEDGIKKWGEKVLRLVHKHFPEEQQLSIVGENGEIEAFTFSGADLTGNEVVDVVPGSSMPTLKAVQDEKVMAMWGAGMFNDPRTGMPDTRRVVRMLGESIATQYFDDTEQDENKALMENRTWQQTFSDPQAVQAIVMYQQQMMQYQLAAQEIQMAGGMPPPPPQPPVKLPNVRDFYDHTVHIDAHNRFRKSEDYDNLAPELQAIIDQHVQEHQQYLMAPEIQAQQQQMAMQEMQLASQTEEAEKQRQFQQETKFQDHYMNMEREALKGNIALQQSAMQGNFR